MRSHEESGNNQPDLEDLRYILPCSQVTFLFDLAQEAQVHDDIKSLSRYWVVRGTLYTSDERL